MKLSKRQAAIIKQFGLPNTAELWYGSRKVESHNLRGWYILEGGSLRYLGRGINDVKTNTPNLQAAREISR